MSETEEPSDKRTKTSGSVADGSVSSATDGADGADPKIFTKADYFSTSNVSVQAQGCRKSTRR